MEYQTYAWEVKFPYLVLKGCAVQAGFYSEKEALKFAEAIGGTVMKGSGNPRNAGRIPRFSERQKAEIRDRIARGIPYRKIAEEFKCSIDYVHKLKSEQELPDA